MHPLVRPVFGLASLSLALAFSFTLDQPTQCGNMTVSWTGAGSNPYLVLIPSLGSYRNVSIPASLNENGKGSFSTQIPFNKSTQFLVSLSDSNGFGSGGFSNTLTVGDPVGSASCNTTDPGTAFTYQANDNLAQCRTFTFSNIANATLPLTVYGIVPGGGVVTIPAPSLDNTGSFSWIADVAGGNSMIFIVDDAQGRQGGVSDIRLVSPSDDSTCLNSNAPSSTSNAPTPTASPSSSQSASAGGSGGGVSTGAIIGTVLGVILAVAAAVSLILFFLRTRRRGGARGNWMNRGRQSRQFGNIDLLGKPGSNGNGHDQPVSHVYPYPQPTTPFSENGDDSYRNEHSGEDSLGPEHAAGIPGYTRQSEYDPEPFLLPARQAESEHGLHSPGGDPNLRRGSVSSSIPTTAARRKAQMAGHPSYTAPQRYILHTDLEEVQPDENGVVELPPQYTPHRTPLATLASRSGSASPPGLASHSDLHGTSPSPQLSPYTDTPRAGPSHS